MRGGARSEEQRPVEASRWARSRRAPPGPVGGRLADVVHGCDNALDDAASHHGSDR